jgi:hypothetical protein
MSPDRKRISDSRSGGLSGTAASADCGIRKMMASPEIAAADSNTPDRRFTAQRLDKNAPLQFQQKIAGDTTRLQIKEVVWRSRANLRPGNRSRLADHNKLSTAWQ